MTRAEVVEETGHPDGSHRVHVLDDSRPRHGSARRDKPRA
jgi:hypothetical protein